LSSLKRRGWTIRPSQAIQASEKSWEFRGAALAIQSCNDHEVIIAGPAETGKTFAVLYKLNRLANEVKGLQAAIVRKIRADMDGTVLQTWAKIATNYETFGGSKPEWFYYPATGARVWVGGLDHPGKTLSSERDLIIVNQAEELTLDDWETLTTRATLRAGHTEHPQVIGDCNPGAESHWIKHRIGLTLLESHHQDNPMLYTADGQLTPQGVTDIGILDRLTGLRFKRLRLGQWVSAEGVIYEFSESTHMIDPFPIPSSWRRFRAVDFGFTHPFVCGWFAEDEDGRLYLYRQIYMTGRTVRAHSVQIKEMSAGERIEATVCDHDAEDMATLRENGIPTTPATKAVTTGIEKVQERLKVQADGRPRLFVMRGSLVEVDNDLETNRKPISTEKEFPCYIWKDHKSKDEPVKEDDHGMDMTRYAVMYRDGSHTWVRKPLGER